MNLMSPPSQNQFSILLTHDRAHDLDALQLDGKVPVMDPEKYNTRVPQYPLDNPAHTHKLWIFVKRFITNRIDSLFSFSSRPSHKPLVRKDKMINPQRTQDTQLSKFGTYSILTLQIFYTGWSVIKQVNYMYNIIQLLSWHAYLLNIAILSNISVRFNQLIMVAVSLVA